MKYHTVAPVITRSPAMIHVTEIMIFVLFSKLGSNVAGGIASGTIKKNTHNGPQFIDKIQTISD